jgi:hypothetical protein
VTVIIACCLLSGRTRCAPGAVGLQHGGQPLLVSLAVSLCLAFTLCTCSVDIFFLDWEKPRRILAKGGGREEPGPISAWRTLLVANEWNELQTLRFTCPTFTLLTAVSALPHKSALHFKDATSFKQVV